MDVFIVLSIYGAILVSVRGVFTHSADNTDDTECKNSDLSRHTVMPFHDPTPYFISFNVSDSSFPQRVIKLYKRARRLPNMDYLLHIKGDLLKIWEKVERRIDLNIQEMLKQCRNRHCAAPISHRKKRLAYPENRLYCRYGTCFSRFYVNLVKYVQMFPMTGHILCFSVHFLNYMHLKYIHVSPGYGRYGYRYGSSIYRKRMSNETSSYLKSLLSSFLLNNYKHASPNELPDVLSFYNGTALSFINETCSDDDVLFPTLPSGTTIVNVINTNCAIDLLGLEKAREKSKISVMNLTGSEKTTSILLERLTTGDFCRKSWEIFTMHTCQMHNLVSLDISHSFLTTESSFICSDNNNEMKTTLPVIKLFYARNVVKESCNFNIQKNKYMSCLLVRHSKCCRQSTFICIKPETLEVLDVAENNIEYIDSSITDALTGLKFLDISGNLLHIRNGGADINLGRMTGLTEFYCSNNNLRILSAGIFNALPNLTAIDLSFNKLTSITFRLQHLHQLRWLNLFKNEIKLSESLWGELSSLVMNQKTHSNTTNTTVNVNLVENPLICAMTCEIKVVVSWLLEHKTEIKFSPLSCELRHNSRIINNLTLNAVEELCRAPLYMGIAFLLGTITAAVLIITVVAIYRHQLSLLTKRRILDMIRNYKEDAPRDRFPVFLSFCSSNADFVMENVFEELNRRLRELLGTKRRCVAFGDADFRPGNLVIEEMIRCISRCDMVIICVSNDFLRSPWCTDEVRITHFHRKPIILMFLEQADNKLLAKSILQRYFSTACRAKWTELDGKFELQPDWNVFCESVVTYISEHKADPDEGATLVGLMK